MLIRSQSRDLQQESKKEVKSQPFDSKEHEKKTEPVISIAYLCSQLDQYDKTKGFLEKLFSRNYPDILALRLFINKLEKPNDRNLTLPEQCNLFQILPDLSKSNEEAIPDPSEVFRQRRLFYEIQQKYEKGSLFNALRTLQKASCCSAENYSILLKNVNFSAELAQVIAYSEEKPVLALTKQMKQALACHAQYAANVITALQECQFLKEKESRDQIELLKLTLCQNPNYANKIVQALDHLLSKNCPITNSVIEKIAVSPENAMNIASGLCHLENFAKIKSHLTKTELADDKDINEQLLRNVENLDELVDFFEKTKNIDKYEFLFKKENLKCILNYSLIEKSRHDARLPLIQGINSIYNLKEVPKKQKQKNVEAFLLWSENAPKDYAAADTLLEEVLAMNSFLKGYPQLIEQMAPGDVEVICQKGTKFRFIRYLKKLNPDLIINIGLFKKVRSLGEKHYFDLLNLLLNLRYQEVVLTDSDLYIICECASIPGCLESYLHKYNMFDPKGLRTSLTKKQWESLIREEFPVKQAEFFTQQQEAFLKETSINEVPMSLGDATPLQKVWHLSAMAPIAQKPFNIKDNKHVLNMVFDFMRPKSMQVNNTCENNIDVSSTHGLS